ncbi:MAG: hypothetical protein PVSMB7_25950 [Chloroflexota bacterium]
MAKSSMKRDKQARAEEQRRRQQRALVERERRHRRDRLLTVGGVVLAVIALAAAVFVAQRGIIATSSGPASPWLGSPSDAQAASLTNGYRPAPVLRSGHKPEVLFVGALYCPFCASERWALVKALGWFGSWSGLQSSTSHAGSGGFSAIPTFELLHAHYRSRYVAFVNRDIEDENSQPLQTLSPAQQALFNRYDPTGGIPMVLVANRVMLGAAYQPSELAGRSFTSVQGALQHKTSPQYLQDINGEANRIAAILCRTDGEQPASVCSRPSVRQWESRG